MADSKSTIGDNIGVKAEELFPQQCLAISDKPVLLNGWYLWQPYQFYKIMSGDYKLTGMDIELVKTISAKVVVENKYEEVSWNQHQLDLKVR